MTPCSQHLFYLIFWFTFYEFWWRLFEVQTIFGSLRIGSDKGGVEDVVDFPMIGKSKSYNHQGYYFGDCEGSISFRGQFTTSMGDLEIGSFKPHLFSLKVSSIVSLTLPSFGSFCQEGLGMLHGRSCFVPQIF
jgi:hypothetical protein